MICELAIDTAGAGCSAALRIRAPSGDQTFTQFADIRRGHAEHIIEQVSSLVEGAGIGYHSLNRISCTMGPGSFTGVRVGIAYAKGLALSLDVPLNGAVCSVVSADKLARSFVEQSAALKTNDLSDLNSVQAKKSLRFVHVIEAGRDEFYAHVFNWEITGQFKPVTQPVLLAFGDVTTFIETHHIEYAFGPGAVRMSELCPDVQSEISLSHDCASTLDFDIRAEDLFELDDELMLVGDKVCPLYLRAPDAKPQVGKTLVRRL